MPLVKVDGFMDPAYMGGSTYEHIFGLVNLRLSAATDVTIELFGKQVYPQFYRISAAVSLDEDADPLTVRVQLVNILSDYPETTDGRYNNCVRDGADMGEIALTPGETIIIEHTFQFDDTSWAVKDDIRIAAFAHTPLEYSPAVVHQAQIMAWPFPKLQECPGDLTGDDAVDVNDLLTLLALWGPCPSCAADIDDDHVVDVEDLLALLAAWGPCP